LAKGAAAGRTFGLSCVKGTIQPEREDASLADEWMGMSAGEWNRKTCFSCRVSGQCEGFWVSWFAYWFAKGIETVLVCSNIGILGFFGGYPYASEMHNPAITLPSRSLPSVNYLNRRIKNRYVGHKIERR
jgi:hypothetical protein